MQQSVQVHSAPAPHKFSHSDLRCGRMLSGSVTDTAALGKVFRERLRAVQRAGGNVLAMLVSSQQARSVSDGEYYNRTLGMGPPTWTGYGAFSLFFAQVENKSMIALCAGASLVCLQAQRSCKLQLTCCALVVRAILCN